MIMKLILSSNSQWALAQVARRITRETPCTRQLTSPRFTHKIGRILTTCKLPSQRSLSSRATIAESSAFAQTGSVSCLWAMMCASLLLGTVSSCESPSTNPNKQDSSAMSRLNKPFKPSLTLNGEYYYRGGVERTILKHISSDPSRILVLFGGHNVGKTSVLEYALSQRKGIVVVKLDTAKGIDKEVAKAFGGSPDSLRDSRAFVVKMCEQFHAQHGYRPVIVFTTTGNNKIVGNDALALASAIREFSCETHAAVCIANLHDLATAQSFPRDGRTQFLNVPELTKEQAERLLGEAMVAELARKGVPMAQVMSGIGGNPTLLNELRFAEDAASFLRDTVQQASGALQEAIEKHPAHAGAMAALSKAPFETGLGLKEYSAAAGRAFTAQELSSMHKSVVYYDFQSKTVKFGTRSLHTAQNLLRGWFS